MEKKTIEGMIRSYPLKNTLPCAVAHYIAALLGVLPKEVGDKATELKVRLDMCQLGLFGYGRKGVSCYKTVGRPVEVPADFLEKIKTAAVDGRIACKDLWDIADGTNIPRPEAGNAADSLGIKIKPCQLGAF